MAQTLCEIVTDGDLILLVTKDGESGKFLVDSNVLKRSSNVFVAMLAPTFQEGCAFTAAVAKLCTVTLPDDHPSAMQIILNMIHKKFDKLPYRVSSTILTHLATTVDKYLLHDTLKRPVNDWLMPFPEANDLAISLKAAMIFDHYPAFKETSRLMLLHENNSTVATITTLRDGQHWYDICKSPILP